MASNTSLTTLSSLENPYAPKYGSNTQIGKMIGSFGSFLAPQQSFTDTMSYDQYAAPQRAAFDLWKNNTFRPEFNRMTLNPYRQQLGGQMAGNKSYMMGNALDKRNVGVEGVMKSFYDQLEQAKGSYEQMIRGGYENSLRDYYNSPTAFNSIGT
jgi:hypothetical protein